MIKWRLREKVIGSLTTRSCRSEKEIPSNDERRDSIVSSNEKQKSHLSARLLHLGNWTQYKNHFITSGHCHASERPCNTRRNIQVVGWDILYSLTQSQFSWIRIQLESGIPLNSDVMNGICRGPSKNHGIRNHELGSVIPSNWSRMSDPLRPNALKWVIYLVPAEVHGSVCQCVV